MELILKKKKKKELCPKLSDFSFLWKNKPSYSKHISDRLSQILLVSYQKIEAVNSRNLDTFINKVGGRPVCIAWFLFMKQSFCNFYFEVVGKDSSHLFTKCWFFFSRELRHSWVVVSPNYKHQSGGQFSYFIGLETMVICTRMKALEAVRFWAKDLPVLQLAGADSVRW